MQQHIPHWLKVDRGIMRFFRQNRTGILWAALILLLSGLPGNYFPKVVSFWDWLGPDKLIHIGMYSVLSFLMMFDRKQEYQSGQKRDVVLIVLIFGTFYGALTEILQHFVFVGRFGNLFDFIANMAGVITGITFFGLIERKKEKGESGL